MQRTTKKFWRAYGALYGGQTELDLLQRKDLAPKKPRPPKKLVPTEQEEQFKAVVWLRSQKILFYHVPNGGYRDYREAAKFKRLGVSSGVPDICIPKARGAYHGLYIELKRTLGGKLSETQIWWREQLFAEGFMWYEALGADDLIQFVEKYLKW